MDGVSVSIQVQHKDVKIDTFGSEIPFDKVYAGTIWTISAELIYFDPLVLARVQATLVGGAPAAPLGQLGSIGTLIVQSGRTHRLLLQSPKLAQPLNFPMATLVDSDDFKLNAVDPIVHTLKWQAMAHQQTGDSLTALIQNAVII